MYRPSVKSDDSVVNFFLLHLKSGESSTNVEGSEEDRRAAFVDSLLRVDGSASTSAANVMNDIAPDKAQELHIEQPISAGVAYVDLAAQSTCLHSSLGCIVEQTLLLFRCL